MKFLSLIIIMIPLASFGWRGSLSSANGSSCLSQYITLEGKPFGEKIIGLGHITLRCQRLPSEEEIYSGEDPDQKKTDIGKGLVLYFPVEFPSLMQPGFSVGHLVWSFNLEFTSTISRWGGEIGYTPNLQTPGFTVGVSAMTEGENKWDGGLFLRLQLGGLTDSEPKRRVNHDWHPL